MRDGIIFSRNASFSNIGNLIATFKNLKLDLKMNTNSDLSTGSSVPSNTRASSSA